MTKLLIHPPEGTTSFTFATGCGKPHEFDGETGIDCEPCANCVALMSADERVAMHLRGPVPAIGGTPEERAAFAQAHLADRERYSWRLVPAGQTVPGSTNASLEADERDELERLRSENADLRGKLSRKPAKA